MDLNQFTQFFDNPKVSVFNRSQLKEFPLRIGQFIPAKWDICSFGNSAKGSTGHKMRLAPMLAPNFSNMRLDEHTAVVPLRVLMENYESVFNYATYSADTVDEGLPTFTNVDYRRIVLKLLENGFSLQGSLLDFLGYPIFSDIFNVLDFSSFTQKVILITGDDSTPEVSTVPLTNYITLATLVYSDTDPTCKYINSTFNYRGTSYTFDSVSGYAPLTPFFFFASQFDDFSKYMFACFGAVNESDSNVICDFETMVQHSKYETVESALNAYKQYVLSFAIRLVDSVETLFPVAVPYTTLPLRAFWRVYGDWLTNGNFFNRDSFFSQYVFNFEDSIIAALNTSEDIIKYFQIPNRLWDDDYFTSLLPTAKADNAIEIPANSTVLDLAKLTAMQKLVLKLSYSSRYRDVIWNVFKIKPSDARLQQSSIISQRSHDVGIGETLQTSETTVSSVLGSFAGRGYSSGRSNGYHVFCEEPCVIMDFVSIMCKASYKDALHPLIHLHDPLDFPIPDMDVLGNTPVYADIVTGSPLDSDTVLGYGRQYQEWLYSFGTVHGDFKTTLDYWQLTRSFNEVAVINDDFLRMNDADDFDSIFSVPNAPHAFLSIYYKASVSRHVHRSVRIMI